jgi:AraC family transcriptional activator of tynA and feaB
MIPTSNLIEPLPTKPQLSFEEWRSVFALYSGQYNLESAKPKAFSGWIQPRSVCGLLMLNLSCNTDRLERTRKGIRADGVDDFHVLLTLAGRSTLLQSNRNLELSAGDIVLLDKAKPLTLNLSDRTRGEWLCLRLPRRAFVSHLGFEPKSGLRAQAHTLAGRLLFQLVREANRNDEASVTDPYMQLAVYDLLGSLFAKSDPMAMSAPTDKLFLRISKIIGSSFTDPNLEPGDVAHEAGVSLRYLQKLFTARGTTYTHFIQALRLDHALRLVRRRNSLGSGQPLSQIAWDSGFRDYNHFARGFRRRFGYSPGSVGNESQGGNEQGVSTFSP